MPATPSARPEYVVSVEAANVVGVCKLRCFAVSAEEAKRAVRAQFANLGVIKSISAKRRR